MATYYLVGNCDDSDDLYLVGTADRTVCPIPREVWEDVVAMFQDGDADARRDAAASLLAGIERDRAAGRPVRVALAANHLSDVLVTLRIESVERAMERDDALGAALAPHLSWNRADA
jgi:hypothetical protein